MGGARAQGAVREDRRQLAERLREGAAEIEEAIFDRICALERSTSERSPHLQGLRGVVRAALRHGLDAVELGEQRTPPHPAIIDHARKAAWRSIPVETLYSRYFAGYSTFQHFLLRQSDSIEVARQIQGPLDLVYQRLVQAVAEEHKRELQKRNRTSDLRRLERVQELLSGEILEASDLQYPFDATHVGIVASGPEISSTIRRLLTPLASRMLIVRPEPDTVWAWVVVRPNLSSKDLADSLPTDLPPQACISIGESAKGQAGWRLTHDQAEAASGIASRQRAGVLLYEEVALLVALTRDDLLKNTLSAKYLTPLACARDGGKVLRDTLRAYFVADRNSRSAAAALGVSRQTVANRLHQVEDRIGKPLSECADAVHAALRMEELGILELPLTSA